MADYGRVKSWSTRETLTSDDLNAEFNNIITNTKFAGTYADPMVIGTIRLWHDTTTGCLRMKIGSAPSTIIDGNIVMEG